MAATNHRFKKGSKPGSHSVVVSDQVLQVNKSNRAASSLKKPERPSLQALTKAAMLLPGLLTTPAYAAEGDEVDFQYGHYQEGNRNLWGITSPNGVNSMSSLPSGIKPIEVESIHGGAKVALSDRVKFAFNFLQDTWGGATPIASSAAAFAHNTPRYAADSSPDHPVLIGASPIILSSGAIDAQGRPLMLTQDANGNNIYQVNNQLTNILTSASPEVRNQGDIKLSYEWDDAALSAGGGISSERDYDSYFGNLGGLLYFNQKNTTLNMGLSYTSSDTHAIMNHDSFTYTEKDIYVENGQLIQVNPDTPNFYNLLKGDRQDWGTDLGLSQVISKNSIVSADISYTRSTGYLANPYKAVETAFIDPQQQFCGAEILGGFCAEIRALMENRPNERNQWSGKLGYVNYLEPFDAAIHTNYQVSTDDWGVTSHTFDADWVQPLGHGWTITPRIRYYSQESADFYAPYLVTKQGFTSDVIDPVKGQVYIDANNPSNGQLFYDDSTQQFTPDGGAIGFNPYTNNAILDANGQPVSQDVANSILKKTLPYNRNQLPSYYSSDHRLAGYGALSGGVTIAKQFANGLSVEAGFEYYTHQSSLKLGGGGGNDFNNYDAWNVNAALKVNLGELAQAHSTGNDGHAVHLHLHGAPAPASVMFEHMLPKAGAFMVGYRYMYGSQSGDTLHGTQPVSDADIIANGCGPNPCFIRNGNMSMNMHMLDLMYAPTDWLTLMLMPQFVDMSMSMARLTGAPDDISPHIAHHVNTGHQSGGIGDLAIYALFKLYDDGTHHVHVTPGISAPTGDVSRKLDRNHQIEGGFVDYGMQLGTGTWDLKPSLTYTGHWQEFSWGAQTSGTVRMQNQNESGYALGEQFQGTFWGGYSFNQWLTASMRGVYTAQGGLRHQYNNVINQFGPYDYTANYGGKYWDVGFGLIATVPSGDLAENCLSVEWLQPVQDDVNGYQLEREGSLAATWSVAF